MPGVGLRMQANFRVTGGQVRASVRNKSFLLEGEGVYSLHVAPSVGVVALPDISIVLAPDQIRPILEAWAEHVGYKLVPLEPELPMEEA